MFEVRVETHFAAAHFLRDYHGKCENLHGHNYKVFAHVEGKELDEGGMLLDFSVLKAALKKVIDTLDHTNLNDIPFFDQNPSAERIAVYIYNGLKENLIAMGIPLSETTPDKKERTVRISAIQVFETETSRATYRPDL